MVVAFNQQDPETRERQEDGMELEDMYRPTPRYEVRRDRRGSGAWRLRFVRADAARPDLLNAAPLDSHVVAMMRCARVCVRVPVQAYGVFVVVAPGKELQLLPPNSRRKKKAAHGHVTKGKGGGRGGGSGAGENSAGGCPGTPWRRLGSWQVQQRHLRVPLSTHSLGKQKQSNRRWSGRAEPARRGRVLVRCAGAGDDPDQLRAQLHAAWTEPQTHGGLATVPERYTWFGIYADGEEEPWVSRPPRQCGRTEHGAAAA